MSTEHNKTQREKMFGGVGKSIEQSEKVLSPVLGRLNLFKKYQPADTNDWKSQVQEVTQSQKPIQARVILYVIVVLFICLIIWAGFAKVDEITRGEGKVIPSQQMQVIQSVDGGVVEKVYVHEGEHVKKGDLLIRIDPTRFTSNLNEVNAKIFALQTKVRRLSAQLNGSGYTSGSVPAGVSPDAAANIMAQESQYYAESLRELSQRTMTNQGTVVYMRYVCALCICIMDMYYVYVLCQCIMCMYYVCVLCVCIMYMYYVYVLRICIMYMYYVYALCICIMYMYYVYVLCICFVYMFYVNVLCIRIIYMYCVL